MNFLKRLFKSDKKVLRPSPTFLKRAPRIRLSSPRVHFILNGKTIPILNLSTTGVGLTKDALNSWPDPGQTLEGSLKFPERIVGARCRVIHFTGSVVGCHFEDPDESLASIIHQHFRVELSALTLIHVNPSLLKAREDGRPYYFQGKNYSELFFVVDAEGVKEFNLSFLQKYIEYKRDHSIRSGQLNLELQKKVTGYRKEEPVRFAENPAISELESAMDFIFNIEKLEAVFRDDIVAIIKWEIQKLKKGSAPS